MVTNVYITLIANVLSPKVHIFWYLRGGCSFVAFRGSSILVVMGNLASLVPCFPWLQIPLLFMAVVLMIFSSLRWLWEYLCFHGNYVVFPGVICDDSPSYDFPSDQAVFLPSRLTAIFTRWQIHFSCSIEENKSSEFCLFWRCKISYQHLLFWICIKPYLITFSKHNL